jgi:hypothetical protein
MSFHNALKVLLFLCMLAPTAAFAANSVLSGVFDGSEMKTAPLPGTCGGTNPLGYLQAGSFKVSVSGQYTILDAYNVIGVDISALVYSGSFNVNSPLTNLVTVDGGDDASAVNLIAGTNYILVVQQWCSNSDNREWVNRQGAWAVALSGPGTVTSDLKVTVPAMTEGTFAASDPNADTVCGNSQYQQSGPVRVSTSGTYYYSDLALNYYWAGLTPYSLVDMCLQIFTAPFNPANPAANRVFAEDDYGSVDLVAGKDYYFVTQPLDVEAEGDFFYMFAPSAPFGITFAMSGSWYFPDTTGQGFLIDVFDTANLMFLAWFTYDLERPASGVTAMIGDPGHRWVTAVGPFQGNTANLDITWNSGMIFDSETPAVVRDSDGTMTVEFFDCYSGRVTYNLGASGRTGEVPIERIVGDAVPFCKFMTKGPGAPGPL